MTVSTSDSTASSVAEPESLQLNSPELYLNRELSHLQFNLRVLAQAVDDTHPLLERLRFLVIFSANLDEFYEIRVAGLKKQIDFGREDLGPDAMRPQDVLAEINRQVHTAVQRQYDIFNNVLLPELETESIHVLQRSEWTAAQAEWVEQYFLSQVMPVVSPLGLDPAHPFPRLVNKSLNFILSLDGKDAFGRESGMAIVPVPRSLPRLIRLPDELCDGGDNFVFISSIVHAHVDDLFEGMEVQECHQFRVIRNADLEVNAAEVEDVALALKGELHRRRFGTAVKLEVAANCPDELVDFLLSQFALSDEEVFRVNGPANLARFMALPGMVRRPDLCYAPFVPSLPPALRESADIFSAIARDDYLLLHPFQSFTPIVDMLRQAARDPNVLAIKMTLYRAGETSELVDALTEAARSGKEVTVVIELRARFDEEENLSFASRLQEAGALVVYGVLGYKTHAKILLIVRREPGQLRRYVHLGTGNYHPGNARAYTDYGLLTSDAKLCEDVHKVFQQLTGLGKGTRPDLILHAPFTLKKQLLKMIDHEVAAAGKGKKARIIIKVNGLTDVKMIRALYRAACNGVQVDLIVRGMCCLRPGIEGLSENIRVTSIVGRFLEHSRVYYFKNSTPQIYCSSADWMERNLMHRVEVCFPIPKPRLAARIRRELETYLADNTQSWLLQSDGSYQKVAPAEGAQKRCAQQQLLSELGG